VGSDAVSPPTDILPAKGFRKSLKTMEAYEQCEFLIRADGTVMLSRNSVWWQEWLCEPESVNLAEDDGA